MKAEICLMISVSATVDLPDDKDTKDYTDEEIERIIFPKGNLDSLVKTNDIIKNVGPIYVSESMISKIN